MKRILATAIAVLFSLFVFRSPVEAVGGVGEPCCNTGYRPDGNVCVNEQVYTSCATFGSSVCTAASTVCGALGCSVPGTCATDIETWCVGRAKIGGAAAIDAVALCATIASTMGIGAAGFATACATAMAVPIAILTGILNSFNVTDAPTCTGGNTCDWSAAPPVCAIGPGGPTIPPYDPECNKGTKSPGIKTALGCLPTSAVMFQSVASPWAVGLGAGVAFLFGLYGAFLIITSSGDPEKVQAGKELITSVIMGLLVIIFAVFLLEIAGADILGLFPKI